MAIKLSEKTKFDPAVKYILFRPKDCCAKLRTWPKKLLHCLDLTHQVNERRLLDVMFGAHVAYWILFAVLPYLEGKVLHMRAEPGNAANSWKIRLSLGLLLSTALGSLKCVVLLGLARKPKQSQTRLKFYLRWYKIWNLSAVPPSTIMIYYIKLSLLAPPIWTFGPTLSVVLLSILISLKIYMISTVIRTYHKLGSQAIDKLLEQKGKEDEETESGSKMNNAIPIPLAFDGNVLQNNIKTHCPIEQDSFESKFDRVKISNSMFRDKIISPLNISIDTSNFIGEGQFGTVYTGTLRRNYAGHPKIGIAAKIVKNCEKGDTLQLLLQEIKIAILAGDHPNIVLFYGISSDASLNAQCAIITEFCELGSLEKFLVSNRHTFVNLLREQGNIIYKDQKLYINLDLHGTHSSLDLMRFAHQIAVGMDHLSSRKIIHADLSARNVLLTKDLTVKLTDFGMSRRLYGYQLYLNQNQNLGNEEKFLPWRWMSYEAIKDLKFSIKSDVWSFGIVLYEIFTLGAFPFEKLTWSPDILQMIENGMRLERPAFAPEAIYEVMKSCWNLDPGKRPGFKELRTILTTINADQGKSLPLFA